MVGYISNTQNNSIQGNDSLKIIRLPVQIIMHMHLYLTESLTIKFNNSIGPKLKEKSGNQNFLATSPSTNFVLNTGPTFETLWNFLQWFKGSLHWQSVNFHIYSTSIVRVWLTDKQVKNIIPLQLIAWGYHKKYS